jgi:hypothetical protein
LVWEKTKRVVLERWPDGDGDDVNFRLVLRGQLPPNRRGTVDVKHRIRCELHPQLRTLWKQHGLLRQAWKPKDDGSVPVETVADNYARCGFRFVPLVRRGMACSLKVLILRRDEPHKVFSGSGDLDGRVKTLMDGLRIPQQCSEIDGQVPQEGEDPFFCLLEDDRHIFDFEVITDRLLIPPEPSEPERDVVAVIAVHVRLALGAEFAVISDVGLY